MPLDITGGPRVKASLGNNYEGITKSIFHKPKGAIQPMLHWLAIPCYLQFVHVLCNCAIIMTLYACCSLLLSMPKIMHRNGSSRSQELLQFTGQGW